MIKKILVFTILLFVSLSAQDWRKVTESSFSPLSSVFFLDENTGWIAGSSGEFLKSTDGGFNWEKPDVPLPVTSTLYSVFFLDENDGFVGTTDNQLLTTTDGGRSWNIITIPANEGSVKKIYFRDAQNGWVMLSSSGEGQVARTTDAGNTWSVDLDNTSTDFESMDIYENGSVFKGACVGGKGGVIALYYTDDGITWNAGQVPTLPYNYTRVDVRGVDVVNENIIHAAGWGSRAAGLQPTIHFKSTDGGATWEYMDQTNENKTYVNLYSIAFKDEMNGVAAGGGSYEGSVVVRTTDGGVNWVQTNMPFGFSLKSITTIGDKIITAGSGGGIAISEDFGDTWQLVSDFPSSTLYSIHWVNDNFAVASGFTGLLIKTTNGGATWKAKFAGVNNVCPSIKDVFFLDENVGFAARYNRLVSKTTDGGETWTVSIPDTFDTHFTNYDVFFLDADHGWVAGKKETGVSAFYTTTDGGDSWTTENATFPNQLYGVHFSDLSDGCVVGKEMTAQYTTDGGTTWNNSTIVDLPSGYADGDINYLYFIDDTHGLACGDALLKTDDGGATWTYVEIQGQDKDLNTCYMFDSEHWTAVGSDNIFETFDGGATWKDIADLNIMDVTSFYGVTGDPQGNYWVSASTSKIFTTAPVVSVKEPDVSAERFRLYQNYPNPFNPATTIKYFLPEASFVSLKLYNALGEQAAELFRGYESGGTHSFSLSADDYNLSSGVYFYSITNGKNRLVKKLLLLK